MRYFVEYPLLADAPNSEWLIPANMTRFAQAAEAAGVEAIALTDHPAPSRKWRDAGGHDTLDPFVGLGFFASGTSKLRLMTYLTVVPYRNPFLLAKSMASVDVVSGGRSTFVLGTGYLRSEFAALGVDMEQRNELFDEGMEVVRGLLTTPHEFHHDGERFKAMGVTMSPPAVQRPYPPMWLGGNAAVVRERVARWGDGWAPLTVGGAMMGKVSRTAPILTLEQFGHQIRDIKQQMESYGRDPSVLDVAAQGLMPVPATTPADQMLEHVAGLADLGVTWTITPVDRSSFAAALESIERFGETVINASEASDSSHSFDLSRIAEAGAKLVNPDGVRRIVTALQHRHDPKATLVHGLPWLADASASEVATIASIADELDFPEGKQLTTEGDAGNEFVVIIEGEAEVRKQGVSVATLHSGDYFGEISLLTGAPRNASVVATTPLRALVIEGHRFRQVVDQLPDLRTRLQSAVADRMN